MPLQHFLLVFSISLLLVLLPAFGFAKLFVKAGEQGWKAYIPFYNTWVMQRLSGRPVHWVFWQFIPVIGWFITPGIFIEFSKLFGKNSLLDHTAAVLIAPFYFPWLASQEGLVFVGKEGVQRYQKPAWREWFDAAVFAIVAATLIRTFVFEAYTIPSGSMEKSLLVNDFLFVSKLSYGPRVPNTPLSVPFVHNYMPFGSSKKSYTTVGSLPYIRWFASPVKRNDAVVFNFPAGDTVINLPEFQSKDPYYDVCRRLGNGNIDAGRKIILSDPVSYPLAIHANDKTDNYIKRCVAIPGDVLSLKGGQLLIDGKQVAPPPDAQYTYSFRSTVPLDPEIMKEEFNTTEFGMDMSGRYVINLPYNKVEKFKSQPFLDGPLVADDETYESNAVTDMDPRTTAGDVFPYDTTYFKWTKDNYGPIWIPQKGAEIPLNDSTFILYERVIRVYENNTFYRDNGKIFLNGQPATSYRFKMNYFWMMGDNRHGSQDSRVWGFVPEDRIVGKAWLIWFSWENGPRWNRLFRTVK
ncbi:MAG: S26 family signal peptidase [Bacteroidota bacterium]